MSKSGKSAPRLDSVVRIKKYANRRLYNTETSAYVTLDDLAEMVRAERDFLVVDAKSGEDLTHAVLTQIILDQESRGESLLPVNFLRQLIRFYGDSMEKMVPGYLEISMDTFAREQKRIREQFGGALASNPVLAALPIPIEAFQRQAQQNIEMFEKTFSMFAPFGQASGAPGAHEGEKGTAPDAKTTAEAGAKRNGEHAAGKNGAGAPGSPGARVAQRSSARRAAPGEASNAEIKALREQLKLIQKQLDQFGE